ncbi:diadenylate cyclase CdaA [Anaerorhabdus furcosa]|uniref:Diadenylate cyclase n=1 Tax=Anaerorhabdus furcosa TaxID=118967 RepID=A0A1T4K000_9FIRM|nr:diadenylate cyclase CdaA [Anaerorhabdus furcosa]SJZ35733.1 TIGR00159 family protein [Anaerorhabdus furcosa]
MINFNLGLTFDSLKTIFRMVLDIFIVWMLLYYAIKIVRTNSRTIQIFKGIALILVVNGVAKFLGLDTVIWLSDQFLNWGFLAIIVVFQPEIRSVLEKLGKSNVFSRISTLTGNEKEKLVDELVTATMLLSRDQTGALISLEQGHSLTDFIKTGTPINSVVTAELLTSIFVTSTPLHDGAVIIQGDRIACASAYFPPTNLDLPSRYGARHRAAIGISEITDAVTIVVSEETGAVSITEGGKILTVNRKQLREYLFRVICGEETEVRNVKPTPQRQLIIEKEAPQDVPAQEYIVEEKAKEQPQETKRDSKFDTAILSKLAIKRHAEAEADSEETTVGEIEIHGPVVEEKTVVQPTAKVKEKKKFGLFKSKKKEVNPQSKEDIEAQTYQALDEEEASIKLPKKKERPAPSYPTQEVVTEQEFMAPIEETIVEDIMAPSEEKAVVDSGKIEEIIKKEMDNANAIHKSQQFTSIKEEKSTPYSGYEHVRVMGDKVPSAQSKVVSEGITSEMTGDEIRKARLEAIKSGKTWNQAKIQQTAPQPVVKDSMTHPIHETNLEDIIKPIEQPKKADSRPKFAMDFNDKSETANINGLTGEIKKINLAELHTTQHKNIEDLIQVDDNLEDQFAMLDTMSIEKPKVTEVLDIKPANKQAGGGK